MMDQTVTEELARFKRVILVENGHFQFGAEYSAPWLVVFGRGLAEGPYNAMMPVVCNAQSVWNTIRLQRWIDRPYNVVAFLTNSLTEATRVCGMLDEYDYNQRRGLRQSEAQLLASLSA